MLMRLEKYNLSLDTNVKATAAVLFNVGSDIYC